MDPYEDPHLSIEERVEDLLSQMTLEEKAGLPFRTMIGMNPDGTLPFELPSSMEAVRQQKEDVPYDSENPLFPFGYG